MRLCRNAFVSLVGAATLAFWALPKPALADGPRTKTSEKKLKTVYVVVVQVEELKKQDGTIPCLVIPSQRHIDSAKFVRFLNLTEDTLVFRLQPQENNPFEDMADFTLSPDEDKKLKVKDGIELLKHGYLVEGECRGDLPGPWILFP